MRILIIEDDQEAADYMIKGLKENDIEVDHVAEGEEGLIMANTVAYDALIVDRMLPRIDGLTIIRALRSSGNNTPVLILSALGEVDDRVSGLQAGGDDYLAKPYAFAELLARLEALTRRVKDNTEPVLKVADLEMDLIARTVKRAGKAIELQPKEFSLLEQLMRNAGNVVTRGMLLEKVWEYSFDPQTNVIDVHISRLRQKIDKDFDPPLLHTIRGSGYILRETA